MSPETVTLEQALELLQLPRVVGVAPDGEEVWARNGRYGPYVEKGKETRSLESEEQLLTIDLEQALGVLAQPKRRRGGRQAAEPLNELGADPATGKAIVVKSGRFGPYATDGETNASLRSGDAPESITLERALELLAERRAKGPAKKPAKRRRKTS
jgi:DNA topoisomerase-1